MACNLPHDTAHQLVKLYDGVAGHGLRGRSDAAYLVPPDDHTYKVICLQLRGLIHWLHTAPTSSALAN